MNQSWVYIVTNDGGTVLYTGVTTDLRARIDQHATGEGGAFTNKYRAKRLVYFEMFTDVRLAIAREKEIKGWRRSKKEALIRKHNPTLENLRSRL